MFKNKKVRNWLIAIIALVIIVPLLLRMISPASAENGAAEATGQGAG